MNNVLTLPFLNGNGYPSPPISDPSLSRQYDFSDRNDYYDADLLDSDFENMTQVHHDDRDKNRGIPNFTFPTPPASGGNDFSFDSFRFSGSNQHHQPMRDFFPMSQTLSQPHRSQPSSHSVSPNDTHIASPFLDLPGPSNYLDAAAMQQQQQQLQLQQQQQQRSSLSHRSSYDDQYIDGQEGEEELVKIEEGEHGDDDEENADVDDQEPLYVNAKQYHRIVKRRAARARLEELNRLVRSRKPYLHESRHRHACSRPRGKGGRFLTAEEIEALKKEESAKEEGEQGGGDGQQTFPLDLESSTSSST